MRVSQLALLSFGFFASANACGGDDGHNHAIKKRSQPGATQSTAFPSSPLIWGDVNFIHTTDSHGWLMGHQKKSAPEPNYSGDFGDFASFVDHMKREADLRGVDLLLVDSGDLHDGTGLSDGYPPGGIDGHETNELITQLPYDVLAIGNHELYKYQITRDMHENFAPKWNGRYLSSNVNITTLDKDGKAIDVPVGDRYAKFETRNGRKVTAFGVLFNFASNDKGTTVQKVQDMVNEPWFKSAIAEEPDFFLLVGHMPVAQDNWPLVFNAIRAVHPTTPIFIFGGHTHIRDCVQYDNRSMALESGRYMETVGWMSAKLDGKNSTEKLPIARRYLDANRNTYQYHTTESPFFDTPRGQKVTAGITALAGRFNLSYVFGTAPQDYYLNRAQYPSNYSVLSLLVEKVLPLTVKAGIPARTNIPSIIITNSGSQRFDVLEGPFTRNDQFIVSPFNDKFFYISVPFSIGQYVLAKLNEIGASRRQVEDAELYTAGHVHHRFTRWQQAQWVQFAHLAAATNLTLGYVTKDSCPGIGDDTLHAPVPYFSTPDYVSSPNPPGASNDTMVDIVFNKFAQDDIIKILNILSVGGKQYSATDVQAYGDVGTDQVFGNYARAVWN